VKKVITAIIGGALLTGAMLGWDEKPRPELYQADGLHLTPAGYHILNTLVRPFIAPPPPAVSSSR